MLGTVPSAPVGAVKTSDAREAPSERGAAPQPAAAQLAAQRMVMDRVAGVRAAGGAHT